MIPGLVAIDVDGTLASPERTVSDLNISAIREVSRNGGRIVIASGRMHSSILPFAKLLGLPSEEFIISYNGGMVRSLGGELLFERPVPPEQASEIVDFCEHQNLHLNYYHDDKLYVKEEDEWSEQYLKRSGSPSIAVGSLAKLRGTSPTKLLIFSHPEILDRFASALAERFANSLHVTKTDDDYLEFMAKGVNKATALAEVAKRLNISRSEVIAFGDSYNDVEMLAWAGLGVAMSNGRQIAQDAGDTVADNSNWSGVGLILTELGEVSLD